MPSIHASAYARAALVGNPSDGYGGKTISVIVRNFSAQVTLTENDRIELLPSKEDHSRFASLKELVQDVSLHGYYGGIRLIKATVKSFFEFCEQRYQTGQAEYRLHDEKFSLGYKTDIPRQVGLAGSSAIVVAALRALVKFYGIEIPDRVLPSLALSVETNELGIGAGLQDRVIQVYEGLVYMDFARMVSDCGLDCGRYERLDPNMLPPLYLAMTNDTRKSSDTVHNPLRKRFDQGEQAVIDAMHKCADYAAEARSAIQQRDTEKLSQLIDLNFNARWEIMRKTLSPNHVRMVQVARRIGASANYTGSGGAIVGICRDEQMFHELTREFESMNCTVLKPVIAAPAHTDPMLPPTTK